MSRSSNLLAALAVAALALAPSLADARAGGGSSMGSRGGANLLRAADHQHRAVRRRADASAA